MTTMKKTYLAPQMSILEICPDSLILAGGPSSVTKNSDTSEETGVSEALSNEREWGHNLWETDEKEK